ncbi:AraC family transcriptional regulator [Romboutsia timonensis]
MLSSIFYFFYNPVIPTIFKFYFSKVFKKYTGITPSEYKKQMI